MQISLNGSPWENGTTTTLGELIDHLELKGKRFAVMVNDEIVRKAILDETPLREGDRVEIIHMVGGG